MDTTKKDSFLKVSSKKVLMRVTPRLHLAPMVRVSTLPLRLLALKYGASKPNSIQPIFNGVA
jgi:hypothetical protein